MFHLSKRSVDCRKFQFPNTVVKLFTQGKLQKLNICSHDTARYNISRFRHRLPTKHKTDIHR